MAADVEPLPRSGPLPRLRAVIDANVFGRTSTWLRDIVDAAHSGFITPIWSPSIVAEASRLLTWLWLRRHSAPLTDASWRDYSVIAHRWFGHMTAVFEVVEDRPPHEALWAEAPRDLEDVAVWNAAIRSGAEFVVTANLRHGPPENEIGLRMYRGITYLHPEAFLEVVLIWTDIAATQQVPAQEPGGAESGSGEPLADVPAPFRKLLADLLERPEAE